MYRQFLLLGITLCLFVFGCVHIPSMEGKAAVMRTKKGDLISVGADFSEADALVDAIRKAQEYCQNLDQAAVFERTYEKNATGQSTGIKLSIMSNSALPGVTLHFQCV